MLKFFPLFSLTLHKSFSSTTKKGPKATKKVKLTGPLHLPLENEPFPSSLDPPPPTKRRKKAYIKSDYEMFNPMVDRPLTSKKKFFDEVLLKEAKSHLEPQPLLEDNVLEEPLLESPEQMNIPEIFIQKTSFKAQKNENSKNFGIESLDELFDFVKSRNSYWDHPEFFEFFVRFLILKQSSQIKQFFSLEGKKELLKQVNEDFCKNVQSKGSFLTIFFNPLTRGIGENEIVCGFLLDLMIGFFGKFKNEMTAKSTMEVVKSWGELLLGYHLDKEFAGKHGEVSKIIFEIVRNSLHTISLREKMALLEMMKNVGVFDDHILDYMLSYADINFKKMGVNDLLGIAQAIQKNNKIVPYELLYRIRRSLKIEDMDLRVMIKAVKVFGKTKVLFMERIYEKIFGLLLKDENFDKMFNYDIIFVLFYYSKYYPRTEESVAVIQKLADKIEPAILDMKSVNLVKMLLIGLASQQTIRYGILEKIDMKLGLGTLIQQIQNEESNTEFDVKYFQNLLKVYKDKQKV